MRNTLLQPDNFAVTEATHLYTDTLHAALPEVEHPKVYYLPLDLLTRGQPTSTSNNNLSYVNLTDCYLAISTLLIGPDNVFYSPPDYCPPDLWKKEGQDDLCLLYNLVAFEE